ncbi:hypothetical protein ACHAXR_005016 [Thalassiosira sp. AJA248-18]
MCEPAASKSNGITQSNGTYAATNKSNNNPKPTLISPTIRRMLPLITSGYIFNTICYFAVKALLPNNLVGSPKYCPENNPNCSRSDLFAFQVVSFINLSAMGLVGFYTFYISKRATNAVPQTPQGRYLAHLLGKGVLLPEADYVNSFIVIFQGWDFVASLFFEEHCTPIMMTHHALAFICGFFCLAYEVNPYYAVYFGGVSEFSSIFLAVSQLFQYFPPSTLVATSSSLASVLPVIETFCQAMFTITFFIFRIVGWAQKLYILISDGSYIIKNGLLKRYCPGSGWFLWYLMSMGVLLGALQVYWLEGIANKILEVLND